MGDLLPNELQPSTVKEISPRRLLLRVNSLTKICDPTGTCILTSIWKGEPRHSKGASFFGHERPARASPRGGLLGAPLSDSPPVLSREARPCAWNDRWAHGLATGASKFDDDTPTWPQTEPACIAARAIAASLSASRLSRTRCSHELPMRSVEVTLLPTGDIPPVSVKVSPSIAISTCLCHF